MNEVVDTCHTKQPRLVHENGICECERDDRDKKEHMNEKEIRWEDEFEQRRESSKMMERRSD